MGQVEQTMCKEMTDVKLWLLYSNTWNGGARGVMVIVVGNGHGDSSSYPDDCISHSTNTFDKGMNPIILPPAMGK